MIEAKHSRWFNSLFDLYLYYAFKRHFSKIEIVGEVEDRGLPILIIANHISWWDGFWLKHLNKKLFRRQLFVMMLEEQLRKNMFLRKLGAFSIRKGSRDMGNSLAYAANILKDPSHVLFLFPQGEIQSQYEFPLKFQNGWGRILARQQSPIQIVMVAHLLDYLSANKPKLTQYIYSPEQTSGFSCPDLEKTYNDFLAGSLQKQKDHR
ncbi:MAG: lysophospholipid acyltransferase family protein [Bacteroidota bacterium]